jgi:hypothetical protein
MAVVALNGPAHNGAARRRTGQSIALGAQRRAAPRAAASLDLEGQVFGQLLLGAERSVDMTPGWPVSTAL